MAVLIKDFKAIKNLTSINGLPISQIEKRAQKITDNTSDSEWRYLFFLENILYFILFVLTHLNCKITK